MDYLQNLIHLIEVRGGMRAFRVVLVVLAFLLLWVAYDWVGFRNMASQEAMDSAQLARSLAEGKGYTTLFVRPFSMYLLKQRYQETHGALPLGAEPVDMSQIKGQHPDIANPPVYPLVLAGVMKVLPFNYKISDTPKPFWSNNGKFWRYQPDFLISLFNQLILFGVVALVFLLAQRLFEPRVARLAALLVLGSDLLWRFSVSGLSTMLLLLVFMGLVWCLVLLEEQTREPSWGRMGMFILPAAAGLLTGLGFLTRYAFGWMILPVLGFVLLVTGRQRAVFASLAFVVFALVATPWVVRNYSVSGAPFGTASYVLIEGPEYGVQRSLDGPPKYPVMAVAKASWRKLLANARQITQTELPKLAGSWVTAFFAVGLLVAFENPSVRRLRYFLLGSLLVLAAVQALGRTQLPEESSDINPEHLLVLVAPLVLLYGVSFFFLVLDQIDFPFRELRYAALGAFGVIACLPLVFRFVPPRGTPIAAPYDPQQIQASAAWTKPDELTMSDMPWAVAWYAHRQCVWQNNPADMLAINDWEKPVAALHLTSLTMEKSDIRMIGAWVFQNNRFWGTLLHQAWYQPALSVDPQAYVTNWPKEINLYVRQTNGPAEPFALHYWQSGWPDQFLLTSRRRPLKASVTE